MSDEYVKLREQLELQEWPGIFMFKFIVTNTPEKVALVSKLFDDAAEMRMQPSKTGKYMSVGAKEMMLDVESIIDKYKKASLIDGLIAL